MVIRFIAPNPYGLRVGSQYNIHDEIEEHDATYYYFDVGDRLPPFKVSHASVKGYAVIEDDVVDKKEITNED